MNYKHGMYGTPTYKSWSEMKRRCGDRWWVNVTYCKRWESFENFLADMGVRPAGTTLDRIDCNGNYEPSNCRWADDITQQNNRKNNTKYLVDDEWLTLSQIARKYGLSRSNLANKVYLCHWDIKKAIDYLLTKKGVMTYR